MAASMPITRDNSASSVGVENNGAGMANKSGRPGSGFSLSVLGESLYAISDDFTTY